MARICPLCQKLGEIREIKPVQINAEEAVLLCPKSRCVWPLGYEDPQYIPSPMPHMAKIPTVKASKCTPGIPISTELSLYTPPVTPVDTKDTTTNLKGTSTDSYASSPGAVTKYNQVSADTLPSIFDIDSPEKNPEKQSSLLRSCDKKTLGVSNVSGNSFSERKKLRPKVESVERVNVDVSDVKRIKLSGNLVGTAQKGVRILRKVVIKKKANGSDGKINSVNICTDKRPMPCNYDTSKLPKINSDINTNKLKTLLEKVQIKESKNDEGKDLAAIENSPGTCKDFLTVLSGNCNNSGVSTPVKDEDINLDSIIDDLESSNSTSQVMVDDDWLSSLLL